jgi:hypothetical protein
VEAEDSITGNGDDNGVEPDISQIFCVYSQTAMAKGYTTFTIQTANVLSALQ